MITLNRRSWPDIVRNYCVDLPKNDLLESVSMAYQSLAEENRYAYVVEIEFGDLIIDHGEINNNFTSQIFNREFKNDISYSKDPLALVVKNQVEIFTTNECSNRERVFRENSRGDANTIIEKQYVVPLNTIIQGDFYGIFGTLDYLGNITESNHGMDWFGISGIISFQFDFPFFHSHVESRISEDYKFLFRQHKESANYFPGKEQVDLIKKLLPEYKTIVIYFPRQLLEISNKKLKDILYFEILKKGWIQCINLRHNSFENKVLSDHIKLLSLDNNSEFIIRFYDYFRNIFQSKAMVLRPLMEFEDHFLIEASKRFQKQCNYFSKTEIPIKPVIYIYDTLKNCNYGFLSMTNLPILKNYGYKQFNSVVKDLITLNKDFIKKNIENYILDFTRISAYGHLNRKLKEEESVNPVYIKGTEHFTDLISEITGIQKRCLKTNFGQFYDAIAIKNC